MVSNARQLAQVPSVPSGRRNLIINGAMTVWQRGTAALAGSNFLADRWKVNESSDGAITQEQDTSVPDGFSNALEVNVTTADTSIGSSQIVNIAHQIEAQNLQHLSYGSSAARTITVSFWVKSNKTGTYCFHITKYDSTRLAYVKEYTIDAADTWEKKTITIEPDSNVTASGGAIDNNNGSGFELNWQLAVGSSYNGATDDAWSTTSTHLATSNQVNWMDSTSNNFYLTGVQLEVGGVATEFEHRSFGEELALCRRYCIVYGGDSIYDRVGIGHCVTSTVASIIVTFPVEMRAGPTESTSADSDFALYHVNTVTAATTINLNYNSRKTTTLDVYVASGLTVGQAVQFLTNATTNARITLDAEL